MKKRWLAAILVASAMVFGMTACGNKAQVVVVETDSEEPGEEPGEELGEEPGEEPSEETGEEPGEDSGEESTDDMWLTAENAWETFNDARFCSEYSYSDHITDNYGNTYTGNRVLYNGDYDTAEVLYNLAGQYDTVAMTVFVPEASKKTSLDEAASIPFVQVLADDVLVFEFSGLIYADKPCNFNIDISNAEWVMIRIGGHYYPPTGGHECLNCIADMRAFNRDNSISTDNNRSFTGKYLKGSDAFDSEGYVRCGESWTPHYGTKTLTDNDGNHYLLERVFFIDEPGAGDSLTFNLDEQYTTFSGTLYVPQSAQGLKLWKDPSFKVWADGELIYDQYDFEIMGHPKSFELDITGVRLLKFQLEGTVQENGCMYRPLLCAADLAVE